MSTTIKLNLQYLKTVNYALFHNNIPICQSLQLTNKSGQTLNDVRVICEGDYFMPCQSPLIGNIAADKTVRVKPFEIVPNHDKLTKVTERFATTFVIKVMVKGELVHEESFVIEPLPYDYWQGTGTMPQTVASFITPNHPAINSMVLESAAMLKQIKGESMLTAYQSGNTNDVRAQVAAVFAALHKHGIVYRSVPASYEKEGQRITLPHQVLATKIGNCIELTLLMASVLEAIDINTVVVIQQGHAYLGVWLVDDCYSCSVCDDPAYIEKKLSKGIDEMLVLECTKLASENTSFDEALSAAELHLAEHSVFQMFIDVKRCRLEHILPLPFTVGADGTSVLDPTGVSHDKCLLNVKEHDRYDLSNITNANSTLTKYDIWERKLLDFSLRNQLLNLHLRRKAVQFVSFDVDRIEDHLQAGEEYCIGPKPNIEFVLDPTENMVRSRQHPQLRDLVTNDIKHKLLHTYQSEGETRDVLKNIYRAARNAIEETGANSLFLAIGVLRWYENEHSATARYAPLLLLPVEMVYKKGNYYVRTRDEEITMNVTLMEYLRQNHGICIAGLDTLPADDSGVNVPLIFTIVREALKEQKRWDVEEECLLGTFSFSKFLMWNDVHSHREQLSQNPVIGSLVENRLTWQPEPITHDLKSIDRDLAPNGTAIPVPVDSSQMAAVIEAGKCNSFILYGPPGTGKSQTITNLIANTLYQGKRVLFVAEKMAALSVVQKRLAKIGLDPFCLELHSNKSTKRHVLQQLHKALQVAHIAAPEKFEAQAAKVFDERKELIDYMNALHTVDPACKLSLYDCIVRYSRISATPLDSYRHDPRLDDLLIKEGVQGVEELLGSKFGTVIRLVGQPSQHPLNGFRLTSDMLMHSNNLIQSLKDDIDTLITDKQQAAELQGTNALRERLLRDNNADILAEDPEKLRQQWREAKAKWFLPQFLAKRAFMKRLKQYNPLITNGEIDSLIDQLIDYRQQHEQITHLHGLLSRHFGIEMPLDQMPNNTQLDDCIAKLQRWSSHTGQMRDWLHWVEFTQELEENGLGCVVTAMQSAPHQPDAMRESFLKAMFKHKAEQTIGSSEALVKFEGMLFDEKVDTYKRMTQEFQQLTQRELYARLAARVPQITDDIDNRSEIGLLNRSISNGGRGMSMRDLFEKLPTLLPRLCPCMLMSPMSVAQYLDLNNEKFDLVVFDEASQMPTSEAVGAIARGKSLVVVGDPKQMPPTSFFSSTNVEEEEASIDDMESILEDCRTLQIPSLQLSWHYRSRHESLIAFSNNEYYDGSLITFPSVDDQRTQVHYIPVDGIYEKGNKRCNRAEAQAIVDEIEHRLRDERLRSKSMGVITFNVSQQGLIEDMLQALLDGDRELHDIAAQMYEPIFIKNLENVQGDERDVILFSIGFGPDKTGKVSMNFGPLNNAGGERRLNVAVSRAREEMWVFSTLKSADIDLRRSKARGVEGLKHFLEFAETQSLPAIASTHANDLDSQLAQEIANALRDRGHNVTTNVGRSKFKVDIAVSDSETGVYRLGLLLDGEGYRDTHTTRDREIVQPSVLGALRWQILRVWSVDWFNNPKRVLDRIEERLKQAPQPEVEPEPQHFDISQEKVIKRTSAAQKYENLQLSEKTIKDMTDKELMKQIVAKEQPITFSLLCRRVCTMRGEHRLTQAIRRSLRPYMSVFYIDKSDAVWMSANDAAKHYSYRPNTSRDITDIPQAELVTALHEALSEQVAINADDLTFIAARKMGFNRRGIKVDAAFVAALEAMKQAGKAEEINGKVRLKEQQ